MEPEPITDHPIKGLYEKVLRINKGDERCNEFRYAIQSEIRSLHGISMSKLKVIDRALYKGDWL